MRIRYDSSPPSCGLLVEITHSSKRQKNKKQNEFFISVFSVSREGGWEFHPFLRAALPTLISLRSTCCDLHLSHSTITPSGGGPPWDLKEPTPQRNALFPPPSLKSFEDQSALSRGQTALPYLEAIHSVTLSRVNGRCHS